MKDFFHVILVCDDESKFPKYNIPNSLSDNFETSWIPLMRIFCLTQKGQERGRSHLIIVKHVAADREDSLMNQTTSRVACICTMASIKVSAFLLFLSEVIMMSELCSD